MPTTAAAPPLTNTSLWTGRVITTLVVLFLLFDAVTKLMKVPPVLKAGVQLGFSPELMWAIGLVLLICTVIYVIPQTSVLGAILLTGYLGGATITNLHAGNPLWEALFPVGFGILVWAGLFLRESRLHGLIPLRRGVGRI